MAHLVIVLDTADGIDQLNAEIQKSGDPKGAVQNVINYMAKVVSGAADADMQITVRDTDPSVSTNGTGSTQVEYTLK